jgi:hypothetical protein
MVTRCGGGSFPVDQRELDMISDQHPFGLYQGDLKAKLKAAFSDFVTISLDLFRGYLDEVAKVQAQHEPAHADDDVVAAAILLEVNIDASSDEIRRALRRKLSIRRLHPDHGGNGTEAARLIAAKNLLIERFKDAA